MHRSTALNDAPYWGTLDRIVGADPNDHDARSPREKRGKDKRNKRNPRNSCFGITATTVTRADGSTYVIPRTKSRASSKRKTAKVMQEVRVVEAVRHGLAQHSKLTLDEVRAKNSL